MKRASILTAGVVTVVVSVGCGGDGGDPSATTRPPNDKTIVTLTEGERKGFCDDLAAIEGGYSHPRELTCDGVTNTITFSIGTDQMNCAKAFAALPATTCASLTVGQFESCVTDIYAETCDSFATSPPSCAPVYACLIGP